VYEVLTKGRVTTSYVQNSANTSKVYAESLYLTQDQTRSDVLQSRMYFTEGEDAEVSYSINAEVGNNKVTKYLLYQGTNIVTLTSPKGTIKPGSVFEPETPVYLQVVCENNVKSEAVKTNIFIKSKSSGFIGYDKEASEEFKFGDGVGFTVPGDVPIIGGTEFEYSIGSLPVTITTENDKVKIAVGFTDFKSTDETWDDFTKKIDEACKTADRVDELSKLCKAYGSKSGAFTLKKGWEEPELNIAGYIEATWDESKTKLTSVSGQILGGVDFKYSYNQQFVVGPVPVYFEVGAGFGIEISATVKKVLMETGQIQLDVPIAFTPSFTIGGGAGINGALSVGAEGELSAPVTWDITNQYLQVKGKGSMKLTASLLFVFSAKHEIASYEKTFVDYYYGGNKAASETEDTYKGAAEQQIETLDLNDYEEYEVIDTSYQNKTSGWTGNTLESVRKNGVLVNEDIIMRYVLPGTRPQIATAGDTTVMVFQSNNGNSDETECTSLMYSVLEDGMWTSPQFYKVRDYVNINGTYIYTNYSDSVKAVPQIAPPTSLSAYSTTDGIRLSWSSSSGANSYEIYRSDKENGTYSKIGTASYTSYTDTKVSYNMTYYYKVVAVNGKNKSSMSKPTSYKYALTAPSYVNVYQQNSDTVRVYVSSVSLADGYELYRSTSQNGKYSKVDTSTSSTLFDLNVTLGKQYYYKARAYKTVNNKTYYSAYSTVSSLTISIAAPYFSSVSAAGDTQIYLLWKEVAGADGYEINAADSYYGTYKKIGTTKDISYLHKVNKKDTYVYYKLRAYKKVGKKTIYSEYSNVSSAMSGFAGPYNIKMAFDGKNNAITFGKCAGAAGTEISVRKGYYGDYEVIANTSGTSYQHKDLMKGSYYYYRFRSYKTAGKTKEYSSYRYMSLYTGVQQVEHLKVCLYRRLR
jgi:fibronectin type 3 domain-containing protein